MEATKQCKLTVRHCGSKTSLSTHNAPAAWKPNSRNEEGRTHCVTPSSLTMCQKVIAKHQHRTSIMQHHPSRYRQGSTYCISHNFVLPMHPEDFAKHQECISNMVTSSRHEMTGRTHGVCDILVTLSAAGGWRDGDSCHEVECQRGSKAAHQQAIGQQRV